MKISKSTTLLVATCFTVITWITFNRPVTRPHSLANMRHIDSRESDTTEPVSTNTRRVNLTSKPAEQSSSPTVASDHGQKPSSTIHKNFPSRPGNETEPVDARNLAAQLQGKVTPPIHETITEENEADKEATKNTIAIPRSRGVKLAENVKLPAAVMALTDPSFSKATPQQNAALQHVVDTFYKDLADKAEADLSKGQLENALLVESPEGEETVIIQPGPDVEAARNRANEIFRALFGDDRYNQVTMQTAMENLLPQTPEVVLGSEASD